MKNVFGDKSFVVNFVAVLIIAAGYLSPVCPEFIKSVGFFALSGAVTNWLAIHMLFKKVPLLYGSGVIPGRFQEFKQSIKQLMMEQFFTVQNIEEFIETEERGGGNMLNLDVLLAAVDYEKIYESLVYAVMGSSLGAILVMMGGEPALAPLREPFIEKIRIALAQTAASERFREALKQGLDAHKISADLIDKIEAVIDNRLNQLTPRLVKDIVQAIIREHLGWLVVWGGIFGGIMGALFVFL